MGMRRIVFLLIFLTSPLQASVTRDALLEEAILTAGAPRVPVLLERAHLTNIPLHHALAREVLIMLYYDKKPVNIGQVFSRAVLPENEHNLDITLRLIDAIPSDEEKGVGPFDAGNGGTVKRVVCNTLCLINRFPKPILFLGAAVLDQGQVPVECLPVGGLDLLRKTLFCQK